MSLCFNPRAPRGARLRNTRQQNDRPRVSIHAPRAGRDLDGGRWYLPIRHVSIHAPRAGRDVPRWELRYLQEVVSIHAPRAGRDVFDVLTDSDLVVSIHAPRAGRDMCCPWPTRCTRKFQSTRPARGATAARYGQEPLDLFQSTRPARGATRRTLRLNFGFWMFQSTRPARGATKRPAINTTGELMFQSTRPARGATG